MGRNVKVEDVRYLNTDGNSADAKEKWSRLKDVS